MCHRDKEHKTEKVLHLYSETKEHITELDIPFHFPVTYRTKHGAKKNSVPFCQNQRKQGRDFPLLQNTSIF